MSVVALNVFASSTAAVSSVAVIFLAVSAVVWVLLL